MIYVFLFKGYFKLFIIIMNNKLHMNMQDKTVTITLPVSYEELKLSIFQNLKHSINELDIFYIDLKYRLALIIDEDTYTTAMKGLNPLNIFLIPKKRSTHSQIDERDFVPTIADFKLINESQKIDYDFNQESDIMFVNNSTKKEEIGNSCLERCFRKLKTNANLGKEKLEESRIDRELLEGDCSEVLSEKKKLAEDILEKHKKDRRRILNDIKGASMMVGCVRERILKQERILQQMKEQLLVDEFDLEELKKEAEKNEKEIEAIENMIKLQEEAERNKEIKKEQEEKSKVTEDLKDDIKKSVCDLVNYNIEKIKEQLCEETINQAFKIIDSKVSLSQSQICIIHNGINCNGCNMNPIKGIRFKCQICPDFNFCEICEQEKGDAHDHPMIKIRKEFNNSILEKSNAWINENSYSN
jgi:hypothetical protein